MRRERTESKFKIRRAKLDNGLTLLHLFTKNDPVAACHLFLPGGAAQEPEPKAGLTSLHWSLMLKGTRKRSARQLAEDIETWGASIGAGATHDYSEISCHAVSDYFLPALGIMAETLFEPSFVPEEVEKEKAALIAAIRSKKESIFSVASEELNLNLYGKHPYARHAAGNEQTVSSFAPADLFDWHERIVSPHEAILATASNFSFERLHRELNALFGSARWPLQKKDWKSPIPKTEAPKRAAGVKLHEQFEQAYLLMGYPAPDLNSADYIPLKVLNTCLGGGMSTRLFQELREKSGLAYDVGSFYPSKTRGSAFVVYMGLQESRLEEAKKKIHKILTDIRESGVPGDEMAQIKNYLKGTYLLDHQTNSQRAHYIGWWEALGRGCAFDRAYLNAVDKVKTGQILKVARAVLNQKPVVVEIHPKSSRHPARSLAHVL